jgi:hypothetical protein
MISINKITPQTVELFNPQNESMGFINEFEFNDIRIQIKKQCVEGYYCLFQGIKCEIDRNGKVKKWPDGFFDLHEKQLMELL